VVLRGRGKDTGRDHERSKENRFSEPVHVRFDADFWCGKSLSYPFSSRAIRQWAFVFMGLRTCLFTRENLELCGG
jgi:hypothetical protein